ncbi:chlorophyllide A binding protein precursor, partial [Danaus plexippus plexippus]
MMMKLLIFLFSFISYLDLSASQYVQPGQCDPNIQLVNDFNVTN